MEEAARMADGRCTCRFLYDGARISEEDTPASLDMEDNGASRPPCLTTSSMKR